MKRFLKTTLQIIAVVILVLLAIIFFPLLLSIIVPGYNHDAYRIDNAEFHQTTFGNLATREEVISQTATYPEFGFSYHAIKPGTGTIIAIRSFFDEIIIQDEERYEKITIWLPEYKDGTYDLSQSDIIAYHSRGGSAWPRNDCSAQIKSGTLKIESRKVSLNTSFICQRYGGKAIAKVEIKESWKLKSIPVTDVNFWIGKPGAEHPYAETYR